MLDKRKIIPILAVLFLSILLSQTAQAQVWQNRRGHDRHHDHQDRDRFRYPPYGEIKVVLPGPYIKVVFGGSRYYYSDRVYYRKSHRGYVVVPPPCD